MFLKKILCLTLVLFLFLVLAPTFSYAATKSNDVIVFADKTIEARIRVLLQKSKGDITKEDISKITNFYIYPNVTYPIDSENPPDKTVISLEDLKLFESLKSLTINGYIINDLKAIENLTGLQELNISGTQITNLEPIRKLTNLVKLSCSGNQITDFSPLIDLSNLTDLSIAGNNEGSIVLPSMKNLTKLEYFVADGCGISDISAFKDLRNVWFLDLEDNNISDFSALQGLTNLRALYLSNNQISNIPSLKGLTKLESLRLSGNQISDITALKDITNVDSLYLSSNQISDITPLKNLNNLGTLDLTDNQISDLTPIFDLPNLGYVYLDNNPISDDMLNKFYEKKSTNYKLETIKQKINESMPEYTFDLTYYKDLNTLTYVLISLKITDDSSGKLIQEISIPELTSNGKTSVYNDASNKGLYLMDLNFDGYMDIRLTDIQAPSDTTYIYLMWNPKKGLYEINKELNKIPNIVFNDKNQEIYGTVSDYISNSSYYYYYYSTFKYINGILTPVSYFSKEYIGITTKEINQGLKNVSIDIDLSNSKGYREKISALDIKTGEMKIISDDIVFYSQYSDYDRRDVEVARFNANSKEGQAILEAKYYIPYPNML